MKIRLAAIRSHTKQFVMVVDVFASSVTPPIMYDSDVQHRGFRYMKPTAKHFCMIKAVRAVSSLNAAVVLAEKGFNQEVCILIRTIVEATSQIEFVMAGLNGDTLAERQQKVVDGFFADFRRNNSDDFKGATIRQQDVHKEISRFLEDTGVTDDEGRFSGVSTNNLMSNVYRNFSNYIHARYPEVMDIYGGDPLHFHMDGMSGTPKDKESLAILECFTDSVGIILALMIQRFDMVDAMKKIPELEGWFDEKKNIRA